MRTELQASNRADLRLSGCAYVVCLLALTLTMASCGDAMPGGDNVAGDGLGAGANGDLGVVVNDSATVPPFSALILASPGAKPRAMTFTW